MDRTKTITTFSILGDSLKKWGNGTNEKSFNPFVIQEFGEKMKLAIKGAKAQNGWFSEENVKESYRQIGTVLNKKALKEWVDRYPLISTSKTVGLILAGNIPLVGFHDVLAVIFSGNKAQIKLSSDDKLLIPLLLDIVTTLQPELADRFEFVDRLSTIDAVIATGSNNTARYFEKYFGHLPHIIRKNRTAVAVINGSESKDELLALGKDIFTYYGLGCRNVSHLILPKDYDLDHIFGAVIDYNDVINHNKYANNYDYYKAIYLMNQEDIIENGFMLMRASKELYAPVAVLHYHFYENESELNEYLEEHKDKIQVVIGKNYTAFGTAQSPQLDDYADGIDTMQFLTSL